MKKLIVLLALMAVCCEVQAQVVIPEGNYSGRSKYHTLEVDTLFADVVITPKTEVTVIEVPHWVWYVIVFWGALSVLNGVLALYSRYLQAQIDASGKKKEAS